MYFPSIESVTDYLEKKKFSLGIDFGLARMESACKTLGHPEHQLKVIHFAGSNGKGSTLHYTKEILISQGYSVGSFTSPAQNKITDQISINHQTITDNDFLEVANTIFARIGLDNMLTEFEWFTLIALCFFATKRLDFVLIETGMGGRLDATNVVTPLVSVITNVSLEHTAFLGDTLEKITTEKAGIIKSNKPVVIGRVNDSVKAAIQAVANRQKASSYFYNEDFRVKLLATNSVGECFDWISATKHYKHLEIQMLGAHQVDNAALAVMTCEVLQKEYQVEISEEALHKGLAHTYWQGRFEIYSQTPLVILDGAHNPDGMKTFVETLQRHFPKHQYRIVFSCFNDKDVRQMLTWLDPIATELIVVEMQHERSMTAQAIAVSSQAKRKVESDLEAALQKHIGDHHLLAVVGSLQLVKEAREILSKV